jgi:hypothetical protein
MQVTDNREVLVERMDKAFGLFFQEAEKLSMLLAAKRDPSSWTSYHDLLRQRTREVVAYERYQKIQHELFRLIDPPAQL